MRILYYDIDTLRADHLGCYGYCRDTSPHINRVASEGVRFENCYASDTPCLPSRASLFTGRFGIHTGIVNHGGTAADLRLHGPGEAYAGSYDDASLQRWARKILAWQADGITVYVYFDNDEAGYAVRDAERLIALVNGAGP